ncbi:hypothetical protein ACIQGZ_04685 [Streptomyces sp. NPDC092296]|uniref:hypothetical protein n=1 Tax=Streptomyces sp. NPDC092296 TaxID=3366012 RepID=UPI00381A65C3
MSETIGNPVSRPDADPQPAAAITAAAGSPVETAHEAYSFACLSCGYGWEQEYDIEHRADRDGHLTCQYRANGVRVPSPLLKPSCPGCGGHTVRIMAAGRVAAVGRSWTRNPAAPGPHPGTDADEGRRTAGARRDRAAARRLRRGWLHLPFHRRQRRMHSTPEG